MDESGKIISGVTGDIRENTPLLITGFISVFMVISVISGAYRYNAFTLIITLVFLPFILIILYFIKNAFMPYHPVILFEDRLEMYKGDNVHTVLLKNITDISSDTKRTHVVVSVPGSPPDIYSFYPQYEGGNFLQPKIEELRESVKKARAANTL